MSWKIAPTYCFEKASGPQCREGRCDQSQELREQNWASNKAKMDVGLSIRERRELHGEGTPEICGGRAVPSRILSTTIDQCVHVRKVPETWERNT